MDLPRKFGRRAILASASNPHPDMVHKEQASYLARLNDAAQQWASRSVLSVLALGESSSLADLRLRASLKTAPVFGIGLARRYVNFASANTLDQETRKVLMGAGSQRQEKLEVLLGCTTPITLERAREITRQAVQSPVAGTRALLADVLRRNSENSTRAQVEAELCALEQTGLSQHMLDQLSAYELEQEGVAHSAQYQHLFNGIDANTGKSALRLITEESRDLGLINLFLANGAEVGCVDEQGLTEIEYALQCQDSFLAAKLRLAWNNQQLNREGRAQAGALGVFHFDQGSMTFARAAQMFYQAMGDAPYTHGCLVCRHSNGFFTSRIIHYPWPLTVNARVTSLNGDMQVHNFSERLNQAPDGATLARKPLHALRCFVPLSQQTPSGRVSLTAGQRVTRACFQAGLSAGLSLLIERERELLAAAAVCGALNEAATESSKDRAIQSVGRLIGGALGGSFGMPVTGAGIGGVLAHGAHVCAPHRVDPIGTEFEQHQETIDSVLRAGGTIAVIDALGSMYHITAQNLPTFYALVTGVALPAYMLYQNWDKPRYRYAVTGLVILGMSGLGIAALSGASLAALAPSAWTVKMTLGLGGTLVQLNGDASKLKAFVASCWYLLPGTTRKRAARGDGCPTNKRAQGLNRFVVPVRGGVGGNHDRTDRERTDVGRRKQGRLPDREASNADGVSRCRLGRLPRRQAKSVAQTQPKPRRVTRSSVRQHHPVSLAGDGDIAPPPLPGNRFSLGRKF